MDGGRIWENIKHARHFFRKIGDLFREPESQNLEPDLG